MAKGSNPKFLDLTGQIFNRLTVIEMVPSPNPKIKRKFWRCVCSGTKEHCKKEKIVPSHQLIQGLTQSCGCLNLEHPGRTKGNKDKIAFRNTRIPIEEIKEKLPEHTTIDEFTYVTGYKPARFIDKEYGEFWGKVQSVIAGDKKHPTRSKLNLGIKRRRSFDVRACALENDVPYSTVCFVARTYGDDFAQDYAKNHEKRVSSLEKFVVDNFQYDPFDKTLFAKYRPDFKISDTLYFNADGIMFHSELYKPGKNNYHFKMREDYEKNGYSLMQFYSEEIVSKPDIVKSIVLAKSGKLTKKVYARKCIIEKVKRDEAIDFLDKNHLMGWANGASYVLKHNNTVVALLSVANREKGLEIVRFCVLAYHNIVGGFSKLLKHVESVYNPTKTYSWVDLRYGTGSSLEKNGFKFEKDTLSWRWTNGTVTFNRLRCRANMDERGLTEAEHAKELKLFRIYDAGQRLFVKE